MADTISKASAVSVNYATREFGNSITITITPAGSGLTHSLRYSYGGTAGSIKSNAGNSTTWTPPTSLAEHTPNTASSDLTVYCDTYSGSTKIGTTSCIVTMACPASWRPTITDVTIVDGMTDKPAAFDGIWIQGKSRPKITAATGSGSHGSTLTSWRYLCEYTSYNTKLPTMTPITGSGDVTVNATVTDSRGRDSRTLGTILTVEPYSAPQVLAFSAYRSTNGEADPNGTQITFSVEWKVSPIQSKNEVSISIQKPNSSGGWDQVIGLGFTPPVYSGSKTAETSASAVYATDKTHKFRVIVTDSFTTSEAKTEVRDSATLINFGADGTGLALGILSSNNGSLQLGIPIEAPHTTTASGSGGFLKILTLKLADRTYNYAGMEFKYHCGAMPMVFANGKIVINSSTSTDPTPALVTSTCPDNPIFIHKSATRTWDVYVPKQGTEQAAVFDIFQYRMPDIEVSFANEQVASLPSGYIRAKWEYLDALYPVGSIIQSNSSTNPGTRLGGTWEQYAQGRTLIGAGSGNDGTTSKSFSVNSTGGKYKSDQLNLSASNYGCTLNQPGYGGRTVLAPGSMTNAGSAEKTAGIDIVQPYIVVYMWRRTA